jgi:hypothetical protein
MRHTGPGTIGEFVKLAQPIYTDHEGRGGYDMNLCFDDLKDLGCRLPNISVKECNLPKGKIVAKRGTSLPIPSLNLVS